MNRTSIACLVSVGVFAAGLVAWSAVRRYKSKEQRERKRVKEVIEEPEEVLAEQLA